MRVYLPVGVGRHGKRRREDAEHFPGALGAEDFRPGGAPAADAAQVLAEVLAGFEDGDALAFFFGGEGELPFRRRIFFRRRRGRGERLSREERRKGAEEKGIADGAPSDHDPGAAALAEQARAPLGVTHITVPDDGERDGTHHLADAAIVCRPGVELRARPAVDKHGVGTAALCRAGDLGGVPAGVVPAKADLDRDGDFHGVPHGADNAFRKRGVAHEGGAVAARDDLMHGATHVEVNHSRGDTPADACGDDARRFGKNLRLVPEELDGTRAFFRRDSCEGDRLAVAENDRFGAHHLGDEPLRTHFAADGTHRVVGIARHGAEEQPVREEDGADLHGAPPVKCICDYFSTPKR